MKELTVSVSLSVSPAQCPEPSHALAVGAGHWVGAGAVGIAGGVFGLPGGMGAAAVGFAGGMLGGVGLPTPALQFNAGPAVPGMAPGVSNALQALMATSANAAIMPLQAMPPMPM